MQIALDGPAGAGKTSIAKKVAKTLDILHLDTGAMYRAVGYKAIQMGIDTLDEEKTSALAMSIDFDVVYKDGKQHMFLDGKDITAHIREPKVSINASNASKHKMVRLRLVELQRKIAQKTDVVVEGRDIGTYVLPEADYKFYITASIEERAKRRHNQLLKKGVETDVEQLKKEISTRDYQDMNREFAPLKAADDAIIVDTTDLTFNQALGVILATIQNKGINNESN